MNPRRESSSPAGPRPIGSVMSRLLARTGYDRQQGRNLVDEVWRRVAPDGFRDSSQAGLVRRGVLEVFVSHSALVQEMGFLKRDLVVRLGELLPQEGITDIRCRVMPGAGREPAADADEQPTG